MAITLYMVTFANISWNIRFCFLLCILARPKIYFYSLKAVSIDQCNLYNSLTISGGNSFLGTFVKMVSDNVSDIFTRMILIFRPYILSSRDGCNQKLYGLYPSISFSFFFIFWFHAVHP